MPAPRATPATDILRALFDTAIAAAMPSQCLPGFIPQAARGRTLVVAAGKAAATMAQTFEQNFAGSFTGIAVVPDGHEAPCGRIEVLTAAHPVPDSRSVIASQRALELAKNLSANDQLVCLLSGGASALLCLPAADLSLNLKQVVTRELLSVGAAISEINCVRKHLSAIKGGRLALAARPADCLTLAISDVPGDDPSLIASGPTCADASSSEDAIAVLKKYGKDNDDAFNWLQSEESETPKPGDRRLRDSEYQIIATARNALDAARTSAEHMGLEVECLGDDLEGDARELARTHVRRVRTLLATAPRPAKPRLLLSGGETTVQVTGNGKGGRNTEYLLALAMALDGQPGIFALACDTDGLDGRGEHAGALYSPELHAEWRGRALDPAVYAANNDSAGFFALSGSLITIGPTLTNVNDFRAILLQPDAWPA